MTHLRKVLLKGFDSGGTKLLESREFLELMGALLEINPEKRINPREVLNH